MIKFCISKNPKIKFEIGTEEAIRRFEPEELESPICYLKSNLSKEAFSQIKYLLSSQEHHFLQIKILEILI